MSKSEKAPEYATSSYGTGGLFGSSTTSKSGTTFNPTESMSTAGNTAWSGLNNTLSSLGSNDYANDPNFQAYQNTLNKQMSRNYDTSVLSQLANRGLMRSSGLQAATNAFADTLADNTTKLYDSYYNRQANNLANYQNVLNNLYTYITGVNTGSQNNANNVSNYNLNATALNNAATQQNNAMYQNIANQAAGIAASALL
jgi:recombinational DNA repair protein (RecF pathway)